jgi:CBS domain-containing protein
MNNSPDRATYRFLECIASQYMTHPVQTVTRQVTLRELEALFERHDFNAFPVVEAGKVLGIVTKFDFLQAFAFTTSQIVPHFDELMRRTVADVMTEAVVHVEPTAPLTRALQLMVGSQKPQLSGHQFRWSVGWNNLPRRCYARP